MEEKVLEEKNYLRDKKVTVKFIPKKGGLNNGKGHILEGGMLDGAYMKLPVPMNVSGTIKEFLTKDEIKFYSERMGVDLSFSNHDYWTEKFSIPMTKEPQILDLSDPFQSIQFKALQHFPSLVCTNPKDLTKRNTYKWVIYNTEDEVLSKKSDIDSQRKAYMNYGRIESNREILAYLYKTLEGKFVSNNTSMTDLQGRFFDLLNTKFTQFNLLVEDEYLDEKVLLNTGVDYGVVSEKSGDYYYNGVKLTDEGRASLQVAAKYLASAKNQELRLEIEAKIKMAKDK